MSNSKWETYQVGNGVRLRAVGVKQAKGVAVAPVVAAEPVVEVEASLTKAELIAEADKRGLDTSGTKADIAERLHG